MAQEAQSSNNTWPAVTDLPWKQKTEEERQWWNEFEEEASDPRNWGFWTDINKT